MKSNTILITTAFLLISMICFGQSSKINFGFEVYTNFADRIVDNGGLSEIEAAKLSTSFGAVVTYRLKPKLALVSGLSMLNKGFESQSSANFSDLRWGSQHDGEGGFNPDAIFDDATTSVRVKHNYYFLSIPLNVRYGFGENLDKGFFFQGGVSPVFYLFNRSRVIRMSDDGKQEDTYKEVIDTAYKVNLNLNIGLGYTFLLKEKFQISIGPSLEYMPFNIVKDASWKSSFYSYGLTTRFMVL